MRGFERGHKKLTDAEVREILYEIATARAREHFETRNDADFAYSIEDVARFRVNFFKTARAWAGSSARSPSTSCPRSSSDCPSRCSICAG